MQTIIKKLDTFIQDPSKGLPEDVFLFISRLTPMVNVDLLIKNEQNETLLSWRDDDYYPAGWHIPGGIIRYQETIHQRVQAVAATELGAEVDFNPTPLAFNEIIEPHQKHRGHFISFLFQCRLVSQLDETIRYGRGVPLPGQWAWHAVCPENLIVVHDIYRPFISKETFVRF